MQKKNKLFYNDKKHCLKCFFSCDFQSLPYSDMIPGGMSSKRTLIIRGMVPYGAKKCV